jgi:hypothetical protein
MVNIIVEAFTDWNIKRPGAKLQGTVHVQVLFVVFNWVAFFYGSNERRDEYGARIALPVATAIQRGNIARVWQMNEKRAFEVLMDLIDSKPVRQRLFH